MAISMTDTGFFNFITHKYVRFRPPRPKFPSLVFLHHYGPANILLHYLLLKNMNILPGKRDYRLLQHQHLHFVVNLFLRISPPCPVPAALPGMGKIRFLSETIQHFLSSQSVPDRFYRAVFPRFDPGISPRLAAAGSYPAVPVITRLRHAGHVYHYRELLKKIRKVVKNYYIPGERYPQALMVKKTVAIIQPPGDVLLSQSSSAPQPGQPGQPGTGESYPALPVFKGVSHMRHVHGIPGEGQPGGGATLAPVSGPWSSKSGNDYISFSRDSQPLNMAVDTKPDFTGETRSLSLTSLTSPVVGNITRKYTSSPGNNHWFFPGTPVPDLYYSGPLKGVGSNFEEIRTVSGSGKGFKSLEQAEPAPVKVFGQETPGIFKKPALDLDRLTDQVFRKLERKITIEKERRGW